MPYWNVSGIINQTTNPVTFLQQVNDQILYGDLGMGLCVAFAAITFIAVMMTSQDVPRSMLTTLWIQFVLCLILWPLGLLPVWWVFMMLAALIVSIVFFARRE
jgi:hypothetical protein